MVREEKGSCGDDKLGRSDFIEDLKQERSDMEIVKNWLHKHLFVGDLKEATYAEQTQKHIDFHGMLYGEPKTFEAKIRYTDYGDLLVETLSNTETKSLGWIYTTQADYLIYAVLENSTVKKLFIINLPYLKEWWNRQGRYSKYTTHYGETDNLYKTENKAVPISDLPKEIVLFGR